MTENKFPSKDEFYENILRLKKQRDMKKEEEYLGYLKGQRMRKKHRNNKDTNFRI